MPGARLRYALASVELTFVEAPALDAVRRSSVTDSRRSLASCPLVFKHSTEDMKECNMFKLGLCIHGPLCRYKHTRRPGPPPEPHTVEACRPRDMRDRRPPAFRGGGPRHGGPDAGRPMALPSRPYNI